MDAVVIVGVYILVCGIGLFLVVRIALHELQSSPLIADFVSCPECKKMGVYLLDRRYRGMSKGVEKKRVFIHEMCCMHCPAHHSRTTPCSQIRCDSTIISNSPFGYQANNLKYILKKIFVLFHLI